MLAGGDLQEIAGQNRRRGQGRLRHWSVENNIHWLRDAVWNEDASRTHDPNTACALALPFGRLRASRLRTTLLAPLRRAGHRSPTQAMETFAHKPRLSLSIILHQRLG